MEAADHPLHLGDLLILLADAHLRSGDTTRARSCLDQAGTLHQRIPLPADHPARARARRPPAASPPGTAQHPSGQHHRPEHSPEPDPGITSGG